MDEPTGYFLCVRMYKVKVGYKSVRGFHGFDIGPFTVLFGKNNAGKTNLLEGIYGVLAPQDIPVEGVVRARGVRGGDYPMGAVYVALERGLPFDDAVLAAVPDRSALGTLKFRHGEGVFGEFHELPPEHVCFVARAVVEEDSYEADEPELWFVDVADYFDGFEAHGMISDPVRDEYLQLSEQTRLVGSELRVQPLFLGWEFSDIDEWVTSVVAELTTTGYGPIFLEPTDEEEPAVAWRVRPEIRFRLNQLEMLATDLLPDFLDGAIVADTYIPRYWQRSPQVQLWYQERNGGDRRSLNDFGRGTSRWLAIAVQVALHLMKDDRQLTSLDVMGQNALSGHVLFVDEPEAHLHPSAVASVVCWCRRMVSCRFHVIAASHHEEFLRVPGDEVTYVKVTREVMSDEDNYSYIGTRARTVPLPDTSTLQELGDEIGMHPAVALSLQRAILFVEGPLDEAVLSEYAGSELDAAGVGIIPIHGTRNLEGLIDGEFTIRLGIRSGILTDNTVTSTIANRSNRKRSSEEKKVIRLIDRFVDRGLPAPDWFGVPEDDLLFALPAEGIRKCFPDTASEFPGWRDLREECRVATGAGKSDSVDWKTYANDHYGLPIASSDGVKRVVRKLGLAAVPLPSLRTLVDQIVEWAARPHTVAE